MYIVALALLTLGLHNALQQHVQRDHQNYVVAVVHVDVVSLAARAALPTPAAIATLDALVAAAARATPAALAATAAPAVVAASDDCALPAALCSS